MGTEIELLASKSKFLLVCPAGSSDSFRNLGVLEDETLPVPFSTATIPACDADTSGDLSDR